VRALYTKTLNEIASTLRFLRDEGYESYLWLSEEFPEHIAKELAEFLLDGECPKRLSEYTVLHDGVKIAKVSFALEKEKATALGIPLGYMFERLYEESRRALAEKEENDVYKKALHFIRANYTEGITVADVARHTGYSESYFGYAFKKKYKMSVSLYIRELQLAKAKDLLVDTAFPISAVASYVGFDDSNYFTAIFKKQFGISPKEFRKKYGRFVNPQQI
jgi:AraC-like DNA-binding protein